MIEGGRVLAGRFALPSEPLREGGSGAIYKAYDMTEQKPVAVKLFRPTRTMDPLYLRESFNRELNALNQVRHPNVVHYVDFALDDGEGHPYIVLEWAPGDLFDTVQAAGPTGWDDFASLALGILDGIAAIHSLNLVHRDIKPENVLIADDGTPKVTDFGISKIHQSLNLSITLSKYGTEPYAPQEEDDGSYSFTRDVFAFGVLVINCLADNPVRTADEIGPALADLDVPPAVQEFLERCTSGDPSVRPIRADVALLELRGIQQRREHEWAPSLELWFAMTKHAEDGIASSGGVSPESAADYLMDDVGDVGAFTPVVRAPADSQLREAGDYFLLGTSFSYRLRPEGDVLRVLGALRLPPSRMEEDRGRAWKVKIRLRRGSPVDPAAAKMMGIAEHEAARRLKEYQDNSKQLFRSWQNILAAKVEVEQGRGSPLKYRAYKGSSRRLTFDMMEPVPPTLVNQPRLIRSGKHIVAWGDVEEVGEMSLTFFCERGSIDNIPQTGRLEFDAEASRQAIRRQEQALTAVRYGRTARADLGDLLLHLSDSKPPVPDRPKQYLQQGLDASKQEAVASALGAPDFLLVEGPPGTGKTTFIAEVVAQYITREPEGRVLIASQTHSALDHALDRVREVQSDLRLLRVGRTEKIASEVEGLSLPNQLDDWRRTALKKSREFLKEHAERLGFGTAEFEISDCAASLRRSAKEMHDIRSRQQLLGAERSDAQVQLQRIRAQTQPILQMLEKLEGALRPTVPSDIGDLTNSFIDRGMKLAVSLEQSAGLNEKLVAADSTLAGLQQALRTLTAESEGLRNRLALLIGADASLGPDELLAAAEGRPGAAPELQGLEELQKEWELRFGKTPDFAGALLARAHVVAATCIGLAGVRGAMEIPFDICVLDEASKATATEALVPMSIAKRWVLVGDRRQLPPFQEEALSNPDLLDRFGLTKADVTHTLFEMAADSLPVKSKVSLRHQFRMTPAIGDLISECFYEGQLESAPREPDAVVDGALGGPVVWISTSSLANRAEKPVGSSFVNHVEIRLVREALARLEFLVKGTKRDVMTVAVLSGYAAQRDAIERSLDKELESMPHLKVEVATVDAFQGREADICIFTLTRSNERSNLGFLSSDRRVNVALSRGRNALVVIGDDNFVCGAADPNPLKAVFQYIRTNALCAVQSAP